MFTADYWNWWSPPTMLPLTPQAGYLESRQRGGGEIALPELAAEVAELAKLFVGFDTFGEDVQ